MRPALIQMGDSYVPDSSRPEGTPRKLLDVSKLNAAGWKAKINLVDGVKTTYQWFLDNEDSHRQ